ncbi:MAG: hypothetical protein EBU90_31400 [Proteobacteria bacterium]|nr:hypothetical protein [Pseudomonadota bacterium]NBP16377.1 hypothetical protein [bacterium]
MYKKKQLTLTAWLLISYRKKKPCRGSLQGLQDHLISKLGDVQRAGTVNGTSEVASVGATDGTSKLIALFQNLDTLHGKGTVTAALNLCKKGLRTKILAVIIDVHLFLTSSHY